jgi:NhaP-type Na+/H+ or K+/H+ antiporter
MSSSTERGENNMRGTWFYVVVGALIGLAPGALVSVTTDVPLALEAGLVLGALLGWLSRRVSTSDRRQA